MSRGAAHRSTLVGEAWLTRREVKVGDRKALLCRVRTRHDVARGACQRRDLTRRNLLTCVRTALQVNGKYFATGHLCTHYKAPLVKGTLSEDGRIMCPWHGACFNAKNGDVEDAPALDGAGARV